MEICNQLSIFLIEFVDTVKPAHAYTFIKQPPVLKGHFFLVIEYFVWIESLFRGYLS
jgi:hypothetical protein